MHADARQTIYPCAGEHKAPIACPAPQIAVGLEVGVGASSPDGDHCVEVKRRGGYRLGFEDLHLDDGLGAIIEGFLWETYPVR